MDINTDKLVSLTESNQNFSQVVKKVDSLGNVVILKNNKPKYVISKFDESIILTDDEKLEIIAKRILSEHKHAFEVLGQ